MNAYLITIPKNIHVKNAGDKFPIDIHGVTIWLESDAETSSASYDTEFWSEDFDPMVQGFRGMNKSLCFFINALHGGAHPKCVNYLVDKGYLATK